MVDASMQGQWFLQLFDCWDLRFGGEPVQVCTREQRLVAFVALRGRRLRSYIAGLLWPDSSQEHAQSNLRAALYRAQRTLPGVLSVDRTTVSLRPLVDVDVHDFRRRVADISASTTEVDVASALEVLRDSELVPGWYDEWVLYERERLHDESVRALETLALLELDQGRGHTAAAAARAASEYEPLRETPHAIEIRAHLMNGHVADAVHSYRAYAGLLRNEMGLEPSAALRGLVMDTVAS